MKQRSELTQLVSSKSITSITNIKIIIFPIVVVLAQSPGYTIRMQTHGVKLKRGSKMMHCLEKNYVSCTCHFLKYFTLC